MQNAHGIVIVRANPGAATADLYFEPNEKETGRPFNLKLKFDDGTQTEVPYKAARPIPTSEFPSRPWLPAGLARKRSI